MSAGGQHKSDAGGGEKKKPGSILAPPRLGFGAPRPDPGSKMAFPGLKASKLSTVAQSLAPAGARESAGEKAPAGGIESAGEKAPATKPSFIPLQKPPAESSGAETAAPANGTGDAESTPAAPPAPSAFVFGQNLTDRAENFGSANGGAGGADAGEKPAKAAKTLTESAAEYCESHAKKQVYDEVELVTGEEDETNAVRMSAKLYLFEKSTSNWLERGRGQLRLNDMRPPSASDEVGDESISSRLVMRTAGSLRVILNTKLFYGMNVEKPTDKNIRLTGIDEQDQSIKVFLVSGSSKDIGTMFAALKSRVDALEKPKKCAASEDSAQKPAAAQKRKHDEVGEKDDEGSPDSKEAKT